MAPLLYERHLIPPRGGLNRPITAQKTCRVLILPLLKTKVLSCWGIAAQKQVHVQETLR